LKIFSSDSSNRIRVVSSGKSRTNASLYAFVEGLPSTLSSSIDYEPSNPTLLYFHENINYQTYFKKDKELKNKIRSIQTQSYSKKMARNVLERVYKKSFINKLSNGHYSIIDYESGKSIKDEVDAVRMLHGLYLIGSNLREEGVGDLLEKYFHQNESAWFAYLHDAKVNHSRTIKFGCLIKFFFRIIMKKVRHLQIEQSHMIWLKSYSTIFFFIQKNVHKLRPHISFEHVLLMQKQSFLLLLYYKFLS
jgi:hypothetical protein